MLHLRSHVSSHKLGGKSPNHHHYRYRHNNNNNNFVLNKQFTKPKITRKIINREISTQPQNILSSSSNTQRNTSQWKRNNIFYNSRLTSFDNILNYQIRFNSSFNSTSTLKNEQQYVPVSLSEAKKESNTESLIKIKGWLKSCRAQKKIAFLNINDGTSINGLQGVVDFSDPSIASLTSESVSKLAAGTSVEVVGKLVQSIGAAQKTELQVHDILVLGQVDETYPMQKKRHSFEYLREVAHLRPRSNTIGAVLRLRSTAALAVNRFFEDEGFVHVHTPIITSNDCEGAGEMFKVVAPKEEREQQEKQKKNQSTSTFTSTSISTSTSTSTSTSSESHSYRFFGEDAFLTVSGQLHAEMFACALNRVYTFGPTFRAENSHTSRHLSEFWMIEPEIAFANMEDIMNITERCIKYVINRVQEKNSEDLQFFGKWIDKSVSDRLRITQDESFARITYTKAIEILKASNKSFEYPVEWGGDLHSEHERYLCEEYFEKPTFVTDYPKSMKPFYARPNDETQNDNNRETVAAMDLLVPGIGELVGGSVREERLDRLANEMRSRGMDLSNYEWYLDLRRYGTVPHAGFGIGFERLVMFLTGMNNIRDVIPIHRVPGFCRY